jgi:transposase
VIDYATFSKIRDCHDRQGLTITQIARTLGLHRRTVAKWLARGYSGTDHPRSSRRNRPVIGTASALSEMRTDQY